jgi:hypothetical protein
MIRSTATQTAMMLQTSSGYMTNPPRRKRSLSVYPHMDFSRKKSSPGMKVDAAKTRAFV